MVAVRKFYVVEGDIKEKPYYTKESESLKIVKKYFKLKDCKITSSCMNNKRNNPYNCECYSKCVQIEKVLKLFL